MPKTPREKVIAAIQTGWGTYVKHFLMLSPREQKAFLKKQGYARFADLLAHIVAWWEEGTRLVEIYRKKPSFVPEEYDVDDFNARAVHDVRALDESTVIHFFELSRQKLVKFVEKLPESAFKNERIVKQLNMEVIGHLKDHKIE